MKVRPMDIYNQSQKADPTAKEAIENASIDDIEVSKAVSAIKAMLRRRSMKLADRVTIEYHGKIYK